MNMRTAAFVSTLCSVAVELCGGAGVQTIQHKGALHLEQR